MKKFLFLCVLQLPVFVLQGRAQTFLDHLQQDVSGLGSVTVHQDPRLNPIVNGDVDITPKEQDKQDDFSMQMGKRKKMRGYRIQVYWGSSQRIDQQKALRLKSQVESLLPLHAYVEFQPPHWHCRVGDFATREEAAEFLPKLRRISKDAMIVRSEVYKYQK